MSSDDEVATMLKLMLENQVDEDGAPLFEPEWEPQWGVDQRYVLNAPLGADGTLALFYQLEEAGVGAAEEVPPPAPLPIVPPPVAANSDMKQILIRLVQAQAAKNPAGISQRDANVAINAVPKVAINGVVKTGAKLLAWIGVVEDTYLKDARYFTTDYAFNLTRSLFAASPEMEGTWDQAVHSDARVVALRGRGEWKAAWELVLAAMTKAHTGDRHAS